MNGAQKLVQILGIVLATIIIVGIVIGAVRAISFVAPRVLPQNKEPVRQSYESNEAFSEVRIELATGGVIKSGEKFSLVTENPYVEYSISNGVLTVREKSHSSFEFNYEPSEIVLPARQYDSVSIRFGAGTFDFEKLECKRLNFEMGAGKATVHSVTASESCKLESGTGALEIREGNLYNGELELGVGKFDFAGTLHGKTEVECGVGKVSIRLTDSLNAYTFKADRGLSSVFLNGAAMKDGQEYGNGPNSVKIESGIGEVEITTAE